MRRRAGKEEDRLWELEEDFGDMTSDFSKYIAYQQKIYDKASEVEDLEGWVDFVQSIKRSNTMIAKLIQRAEENLNEQLSLFERL